MNAPHPKTSSDMPRVPADPILNLRAGGFPAGKPGRDNRRRLSGRSMFRLQLGHPPLQNVVLDAGFLFEFPDSRLRRSFAFIRSAFREVLVFLGTQD